MEPEINRESIKQEVEKSSLHTVTPLSKYLAMALFIILPFAGGWVGYTYAPEKVVEVEKVVEIEKVIEVGKTNESEEIMGLCEMDVIYDRDECWCPESSLKSIYQLDGKDVLFCASEGLEKEVLDKIDNLPSEMTPASEIILPNGMNLEEYLEMKGISPDAEESGNIACSQTEKYSNEEYGFSFEYPVCEEYDARQNSKETGGSFQIWKVTQDDWGLAGSVFITVSDNPRNLSVVESYNGDPPKYFDLVGQTPDENRETIILDSGLVVEYFHTPAYSGVEQTYVIDTKQGYFIEIFDNNAVFSREKIVKLLNSVEI